MIEKVLSKILDNGLYVIPLFSVDNGICTCKDPKCSSPGKHPLFHINWKYVASCDKEKILGWMERYHKLNYAVATGRRSKITDKFLVVVDVDHEKHPLVSKLPKTFAYSTGTGFHYWFWAKIPIKNSVSLIADKVDVRGLNGYVVVPPSKHINGKHYSIINDCEIADFPEELTKSAFRSHQTKHKKSVSKTSKKNIVVNSWSEKTIKEIREHMEHGLIPEGVRNNTLYRLLCSDRANGYNTKKELIEKGYFYLTRFDNAESFTDKELETVVESVLKHPEYNTSFEKVNENYVKWLENHGYHTVENLETKVKEIDNKFFSNLIPTNGTVGVSLKEIITARKEFFRIHGLNRCSSYKPSFLGMKIRSLGFVRRRTSKNNFWNVSLEKMVSFSDQQW